MSITTNSKEGKDGQKLQKIKTDCVIWVLEKLSGKTLFTLTRFVVTTLNCNALQTSFSVCNEAMV